MYDDGQNYFSNENFKIPWTFVSDSRSTYSVTASKSLVNSHKSN